MHDPGSTARSVPAGPAEGLGIGEAQPAPEVGGSPSRTWRQGALRALVCVALALPLLALAAALAIQALESGAVAERSGAPRAVAVEVAPIERGAAREVRTLSGTLEASSRSLIAARIGGQIEEVRVNIGALVRSGDVIATLDGAEFRQDLDSARAELEVARATLAEANNALGVAERNLERVQRLFEEEIASASELDVVRAEQEGRAIRVRVSASQVSRAEAQVRAAEVRLSYATVRAVWPDPEGARVVGERFVDPGTTVGANGPILSLLAIDDVVAVIHVSERDYARLSVDQTVLVRSASYPDEEFEGTIVRLAPEFREASRQARIEVELPNPDHRLKPGMFVRADVELARSEDAALVPVEALVRRAGAEGVFLLEEGAEQVRFVPLRLGIRNTSAVEVLEPELRGAVVVLGQHLLDDGSRVRLAEAPE